MFTRPPTPPDPFAAPPTKEEREQAEQQKREAERLSTAVFKVTMAVVCIGSAGLVGLLAYSQWGWLGVIRVALAAFCTVGLFILAVKWLEKRL